MCLNQATAAAWHPKCSAAASIAALRTEADLPPHVHGPCISSTAVRRHQDRQQTSPEGRRRTPLLQVPRAAAGGAGERGVGVQPHLHDRLHHPDRLLALCRHHAAAPRLGEHTNKIQRRSLSPCVMPARLRTAGSLQAHGADQTNADCRHPVHDSEAWQVTTFPCCCAGGLCADGGAGLPGLPVVQPQRGGGTPTFRCLLPKALSE